MKHMQMNLNSVSSDETAEAIIADYREGINVEYSEGNSACYNPALLLLMEQFAETTEWHGTYLHECAHPSGHANRLARIDCTANFGSESYSKEEFIVEIGSAALVHHCGTETPSSFHNSTAYVQNWLQALKGNKRLIVTAAGAAEKAVSLILNGD